MIDGLSPGARASQLWAKSPKMAGMVRFLKTAPPGYVVEVGVFRGGCLGHLAKTFPERQFYGYDTFEGMPEVGSQDNRVKKGSFRADYDKVQEYLSQFGNVTLVKGLYPQSDTIKPAPIAMAHVDVDIYTSTLESLVHLTLFMAQGGRIYDDDALVQTCKGATLAVEKYCADRDIKYCVEQPKHVYIQF